MQKKWSKIPADNGRYFVFGPRLNRLYILSGSEVEDSGLLNVLGLAKYSFVADIDDPGSKIALQRTDVSRLPRLKTSIGSILIYIISYGSRHIVPLSTTLFFVKHLAQIVPDSGFTLHEIGRKLCTTERSIRLSSCYARSILTAYLLLNNKYPCDLTIGSLTPTQNMHAWCACSGIIPYEPSAEYFMYKPLIQISMTPKSK